MKPAARKVPMTRPPVDGAGGLVLNGRGEVLLIRYPLARGGVWTFPKGHLEAGEDHQAAALREVLEETGVTAEVLSPLGETRYINASGVPRRVQWFAMRTQATGARAEPGFEASFVRPAEALERITHPEDRRTLERLLVGVHR